MDKTKDILENFVSIRSGSYHFLARPRRFGKSLICSVVNELFRGDAKLFEGLYIYDKWDFLAEKCPVIHIQIDLFPCDSVKEFVDRLSRFLHELAADNDISIPTDVCDIDEQLAVLIKQLYRKYSKQVVVIIDEYDAPIHNCIDRPEELENVGAKLSRFYGVLKPLQQYLRLVYITGILKFSNLSLFSKLNNIEDHTFSLNLSHICGYTRSELESNFMHYLEHFAQEHSMSHDELMLALTEKFNGYCFAVDTRPNKSLPPKVYNPFAINRALKECTFDDKWIESGHCGYLVALIMKKRASGRALENVTIPLDDLQSISTPSNLSIECLMYYAGYSTICNYNRDSNQVTLTPPNASIGRNVMKEISNTISRGKVDNEDLLLARELVKEIFSEVYHHQDGGSGDGSVLQRHAEAVTTIMNRIVLLFPHQLLRNNRTLESTFNVMFSSFLRLGCSDHRYLGKELSTSTGDIECAIESANGKVVAIFEFKNRQSVHIAMDQIKSKGFAKVHRKEKTILVAINVTEQMAAEVLIEIVSNR